MDWRIPVILSSVTHNIYTQFVILITFLIRTCLSMNTFLYVLTYCPAKHNTPPILKDCYKTNNNWHILGFDILHIITVLKQCYREKIITVGVGMPGLFCTLAYNSVSMVHLWWPSSWLYMKPVSLLRKGYSLSYWGHEVWPLMIGISNVWEKICLA